MNDTSTNMPNSSKFISQVIDIYQGGDSYM